MLGRSWTGGQDSSSSLHISYGLTHLFLVYFILSLANVSCIPALSPSTNTQIHDAVYTNALLATYVHTLVCSLLSRVFIPACRLNLRPQHPSSRRINSSEEETGTSFVLSSVSPNTELRRAFDTKVSELYKMFLDPPPLIQPLFYTKSDQVTSIDGLAARRQTQSHSVILPATASSSRSDAGPYIGMTIEKASTATVPWLRGAICVAWMNFFFFLRSPRTRTHHDPFAEQKHLFFFQFDNQLPCIHL